MQKSTTINGTLEMLENGFIYVRQRPALFLCITFNTHHNMLLNPPESLSICHAFY